MELADDEFNESVQVQDSGSGAALQMFLNTPFR